MVKEAKKKYLSELIANNYHNPRVRFSTINSVINPSERVDESLTCEDFFHFFVNKIMTIRSEIVNCNLDPLVPTLWICYIYQF